jgi:hypothetical protein
MELLSPGTGLIIWQLFALGCTLLFIAAWVVILRSKLDPTTKLIWMLGTLFLPIIGPVLFFLSHSSLKKSQ